MTSHIGSKHAEDDDNDDNDKYKGILHQLLEV
jgi:hypothetical protein